MTGRLLIFRETRNDPNRILDQKQASGLPEKENLKEKGGLTEKKQDCFNVL